MPHAVRLAAAAAILTGSLAAAQALLARPHGDASAAAPTAAAAAPSAGRTGLVMGMPSALGPVLTDDQMMTLYRSDRDSRTPSRSACTGACAATWRPVLVSGAVTFADGDAALLGTVARPDGSRQLTVKGWPVYRFAGDHASGQATGNGRAGGWHAVKPDGSAY